MKQIVFLVLAGSLLLSCSSPQINGKSLLKDEILSTAGDSSMPNWASEGELKPFIVKNGKAFSVGITTGRGSDRPEALSRVAENNARANFSKTIENKLEFVFQNAEENAGIDATQAKWIGSEVSSLTTSSMSLDGHWWKRYAQSDEDGSRHIYYKVYALIVMPESDLKQAISRAVNKGVGEHKLSENFQKQADKHLDKIMATTVEPQQAGPSIVNNQPQAEAE